MNTENTGEGEKKELTIVIWPGVNMVQSLKKQTNHIYCFNKNKVIVFYKLINYKVEYYKENYILN